MSSPPPAAILHLDKRDGSRALAPYLLAHGIQLAEGIWPADIEFLGTTALGECTPIGIEHKSAVTGDAFTSMSDGRLTGEQLPRMVEHYPAVRYVIIEGNTRRAADGTLELSRKPGSAWEPAYSRSGAGWTYREFKNRIESIEEFWSYPHCSGRTRVVETYDAYESAAFIVDRYHYWQRPYEQHSSARQWDHSQDIQQSLNPLARNRRVPLVQLWAADIDGIGPKLSSFVARHFETPISLALAGEGEWKSVEYKVGKVSDLKTRHFGIEQIRKFIAQIRNKQQ